MAPFDVSSLRTGSAFDFVIRRIDARPAARRQAKFGDHIRWYAADSEEPEGEAAERTGEARGAASPPRGLVRAFEDTVGGADRPPCLPGSPLLLAVV
mmetsp:Transcript_586/g.1322  ORF Transcript_586/g.1322 Transcript_586/m.1322 type:complete len:97 (-) Transcript_586:188-478(-)